MASKKFLEYLFSSHSADLKSVVIGIEDVFICPICLNKFTHDAIHNRSVTDGHVWPKYLRKQSGNEKAVLQRVLLCEKCNHTAGSRGDSQLQLLEKVKVGEKIGEFYGERRVDILLGLGEKPIELNASIVQTESLSGKFNFNKLRNNPKELKRFFSLGSDEKFSILMHPYHKFEPVLAEVGLITSAYLFAFYTFGYRYIFQEILKPVREYIIRSFEVELEKLSKPEDVKILVDNDLYRDIPEIGLVVPLDKQTSVYLQIGFLNWLVQLPFQFVEIVLEIMIYEKMPDIKERLEEVDTNEGFLYISVDCNKLDKHDCIWDYLLGKPIPATL